MSKMSGLWLILLNHMLIFHEVIVSTFAANNHDDTNQLADDTYHAIIHFKRVNNFHFINKQFEAINQVA